MADDTTTEAPEVQPGADPAQPADPAPASAEPEPTAEPTEEQPAAPAQPEEEPGGEGADPAQPDQPVDVTAWAANKGLSLETENERKLAKMAYESEQRMHQSNGRASELERSVGTVSDQAAEQEAARTGEDPELLKRVQRMEVKANVRDFWNTPLANGQLPDRGMEQAMIKELQVAPYLAGDLSRLYKSVAFDQSGVTAKSAGAREALQTLAHKQQAAVPAGNATNGAAMPTKKKPEDMSIEEMEQQYGFAKR